MIEIREKIAPYSHLPGTRVVVPCSDWVVEVFPTLLRTSNGVEFPFGIESPVEAFRVQMDLERDCVWISGKSSAGHFRLKLNATPEGLFLTVKKGPQGAFAVGKQWLAQEGNYLSSPPVCERLSLGNWKAQEMELIRKRKDVREIVPTLFLLGQKIPAIGTHETYSNYESFSGLFVPPHLGILPFAYRQIRQHLIQEVGEEIHILPGIKEYPVGRAKLNTSFGLLHLEWTQGRIRKMTIQRQPPKLVFPEPLTHRVSAHQGFVLFDRFQKA